MIDVFNRKITLRVGDDEVIFDVDHSIKKPPTEDDECYGIDALDEMINVETQELLRNDQDESGIDSDFGTPIQRIDPDNMPYLVTQEIMRSDEVKSEHLYSASANEIDEKKPQLKDLPHHLEYAYLHGDKSFPIIISSKLSEKEKILLFDFAVGAVLGQRIDGKFKSLYYASKTVNNSQEHYATTEKELIAVVFSFAKFCWVFTEEEITDEFLDEHLMMFKAKPNEDKSWMTRIDTFYRIPEIGFCMFFLYVAHDLAGKEIDNIVIMEYLVKISKKVRILKLKRRHLKIIVLTSYMSFKREASESKTSMLIEKDRRSVKIALEGKITFSRIPIPDSEGMTSTGREESQGRTKEEGEPEDTVQPPPNPPEKALKQLKKLRERMNTLKGQMGRNLEAYVDDMVIKSKTEPKMIKDVEETLLRLKKGNIKLNPQKCSFKMEEGKFLRYIVTFEGIRANSEKAKAVINMPSPRNLKQMQRLSDKLPALNRFLSKAAKKALPCLDTLKKSLKKEDKLVVYLSVNNKAVSAILLVERHGRQAPIHYVNRTLQGAKINYPPMDMSLDD
uniref:Reverse transcriptase domain-containing protein n=1 Tax=Tanacetum cinerariifolium TaxID=118510 RepID=A0A6L2MKN5_TANCI|nr:reverse transcriptase domain-containing protein [Tanacetum cinerariifolium]